MKAHRYNLDSEAKRLMGMSSVSVYECRYHPNPSNWYFEVVWGGKCRWSVPHPWEANKDVLRQVGLSLRNKIYADEQLELALADSQNREDEQKRDDASDSEAMVKECYRTAVQKPLYFYNK